MKNFTECFAKQKIMWREKRRWNERNHCHTTYDGASRSHHHLFSVYHKHSRHFAAFLLLFAMIVHKSWIVNSALSAVIAVTCVVGDIKLQTTKGQLAKSICDNSTHALVGFFSAIIILTDHLDQYYLAVACLMMSSMIDADHLIAARSLKLSVRKSISRI